MKPYILHFACFAAGLLIAWFHTALWYSGPVAELVGAKEAIKWYEARLDKANNKIATIEEKLEANCKNCTLPKVCDCTKECCKEPVKKPECWPGPCQQPKPRIVGATIQQASKNDACDVCGVKGCCGPLCACHKECHCGVGGRVSNLTFGTAHEICPTANPLKVEWVDKHSIAHKMGVKAGDILMEVGGVQIRRLGEVIILARDCLKRRENISVKVNRCGDDIILIYGTRSKP